jgi:hypothetical protein
MRKLIARLAAWLLTFTYERVTLDKVNKKLIKPVEGLIINGVQYYEFVSIGDMPQERFVHYQHLRQEAVMNLDRETLNRYFDELKKANNGKDTSRIGALLYMLQDTINNCTPLEVLYNLAALVYFDKHEDIGCFDGDYNARKIALFKELPNQGFFLTRLLQKGLKLAGEQSPDDILKSLRQSAVKLKAYQQILFEHSETTT